MHRILAAIAVALLNCVSAAAQPRQAPAAISTDQVVRGLEAQYQASLIRERRLADDRERRLISEYESRMRLARANYDLGVAGAADELARARVAYAELVSEIAQRESALRIEMDAYHAEALGLAERASPNLLAAYQRFADGDRVGAWPAIEQLTQAQVRATMSIAGVRAAAQLRDAAWARSTMAANGEATASEVLGLWEQVAHLDPGNFWAHRQITYLAIDLGDLPRARDAASQAVQTSVGDVQRSFSLDAFARAQLALGDSRGARASAEENVRILRRLAAADPNNPFRRAALATSLALLGDAMLGLDEPAGQPYFESLEISRRLASADPSNFGAQHDLLSALNSWVDWLRLRGSLGDDTALAYASEAATIARELLTKDPTNLGLQGAAIAAVSNFAAAHTSRNNLRGARSLYEESAGLARRLAFSSSTQMVLGIAYQEFHVLGRTQERLGETAGAIASYREALEFARRRASLLPRDEEAQAAVIVLMARLAGQQNGDVMWADVFSAMEEKIREGVFGWDDAVNLFELAEREGYLARGGMEYLGMARSNAATTAARQ